MPICKVSFTVFSTLKLTVVLPSALSWNFACNFTSDGLTGEYIMPHWGQTTSSIPLWPKSITWTFCEIFWWISKEIWWDKTKNKKKRQKENKVSLVNWHKFKIVTNVFVMFLVFKNCQFESHEQNVSFLAHLFLLPFHWRCFNLKHWRSRHRTPPLFPSFRRRAVNVIDWYSLPFASWWRWLTRSSSALVPFRCLKEVGDVSLWFWVHDVREKRGRGGEMSERGVEKELMCCVWCSFCRSYQFVVCVRSGSKSIN